MWVGRVQGWLIVSIWVPEFQSISILLPGNLLVCPTWHFHWFAFPSRSIVVVTPAFSSFMSSFRLLVIFIVFVTIDTVSYYITLMLLDQFNQLYPLCILNRILFLAVPGTLLFMHMGALHISQARGKYLLSFPTWNQLLTTYWVKLNLHSVSHSV